jgi:hypothetical protein
MNKILKMCALLVVAWGLVGCFQVDQVITVLPDGSGTVEETMLVSRKIAESMAAFAGGMAELGDPDATGEKKPSIAPQSFFKDDDIKKRAEGFGTTARFVKSERIVNERFEGYRAVYAFKDINTLRIEPGNAALPKQPGVVEAATAKGTEFVFTPGKRATLVMKRPKNSGEEKAPVVATEPPPQANPGDLDMLRQMFAGLRLSTTLVIKGQVVESNATHRAGSVITLTEVDFDKILDKPELLTKIAALPPGDQGAAMAMIKSFPGMKVDMNDEMRVMFK